MSNKTLPEKIYSALGFWKYREKTDNGTYEVFYWCCLPYGKFFRKFDLFRVDAFYYEGEYDEGDCLYMKIQRVEYDVTRCDVYRRNAVNLEDGSLTFVDDDDTVTIANVYIKKD